MRRLAVGLGIGNEFYAVLLVCLAYAFLVGTHLGCRRCGIHLQAFGQQRCLRGVASISYEAIIERGQTNGCVHRRGGGAAYYNWCVKTLALEEAAESFHLFERRRDEPAYAHEEGLMASRSLEYDLRRHHDAEVDDLESIARQHNGYDVLAYIVDIAGSCGQHHARARRSRGALCGTVEKRFHESHGLFHHLRSLHYLRQKHLAFGKAGSDLLHGLHQRTLYDGDWPSVFFYSLRDVGGQMFGGAGGQGLGQTLFDTKTGAAPTRSWRFGRQRRLGLGCLLETRCQFQQALGCALVGVEHNVLHGAEQL